MAEVKLKKVTLSADFSVALTENEARLLKLMKDYGADACSNALSHSLSNIFNSTETREAMRTLFMALGNLEGDLRALTEARTTFAARERTSGGASG